MEKNTGLKQEFNKKILIITLTFMFILPMSIFSNKDFFTLNKAVLNGIVILLYVEYIYRGFIKIEFMDKIIIGFMIFRFITTKDLESFGLSYLLVVRYLDFTDIDLQGSKIFYLLPLSVIFYSILHRFHFSEYVVSTSIGEINQVGFSLIMLFLIFKFNNYKLLANITVIIGLFTYSRNFFLAVVLYFGSDFLLQKLKGSKYESKIPTSFGFYSVLSIIGVMGLFFLFSQITDVSQLNNSYGVFGRFFSYFDHSNFLRFTANVAVLRFYIFKPIYLLTGIPFELYRKYLEIYSFGFGKFSSKVNAPHNYYFKFLYKYGIFSLVVFSITAKAINKRLNVSNLPVFLTFLLYAVFLGTGFYEAYLVILIYLLDQYNVKVNMIS